jgi:hypothetical protein
VARVRRHPAWLALLVVYLIGAGIALWLAPMLGAILLVALGLVGSTVLVPSLFTLELRGPGHQYRDESSPLARRKRRSQSTR